MIPAKPLAGTGLPFQSGAFLAYIYKAACLHSNSFQFLAWPVLGTEINEIVCPLQVSHMGPDGGNDNESLPAYHPDCFG